MLTVKCKDVPEYLQRGKLYQIMSENAFEEFDVPAVAFRSDCTFSDVQDLMRLLDTLRYWIVESSPEPLISGIMSVDSAFESELAFIVAAFAHGLTYLPHILKIRNLAEDTNKLKEAVRIGSVELIKFVRAAAEDSSSTQLTAEHCLLAMQSGNVESLAFLHSAGCPWYRGYSEHYFPYKPAVLAYTLEHCPEFRFDFAACVEADNSGLVDCLLAHGRRWMSDTMQECASQGQWSMVQLLHKHGYASAKGITSMAAYQGRLEMLQWAHHHGIPWDPDIASEAARGDQLECLRFAHEHGAPWSGDTVYHAAVQGSLQCLTYAHQHGCPRPACTGDYSLLSLTAAHKHWRCFKYALEHGCPYSTNVAATVASASLPVLQNLIDNGHTWDLQACMEAAAGSGNVPVLAYLYKEHRGQWTGQVLCCVVFSGSLPALQLAHEAIGTERVLHDSQLCNCAAESSLACLQYLHERGGAVDYETVRAAAMGGRLDCLQYLVAQGCPLSASTIIRLSNDEWFDLQPALVAAAHGHLDCLRYLHEQGCSVTAPAEYIEEAVGEGECADYLYEHNEHND